MSEKVITSLEQVTNEWLTTVLRRSGALTQGAVVGFEADSGRGNWSTSGSLDLHYRPHDGLTPVTTKIGTQRSQAAQIQSV